MSLLSSIQGFGESLLGRNIAAQAQAAEGNSVENAIRSLKTELKTKHSEAAQAIGRLELPDSVKNLNLDGILKDLETGRAAMGQERLSRSSPATTGLKGMGGLSRAPSFEAVLEELIDAVDGKSKAAGKEVQSLMAGESDNLHQSVVAMQEAGVAFTLLVEVRNKLVESYQELMRMQA